MVGWCSPSPSRNVTYARRRQTVWSCPTCFFFLPGIQKILATCNVRRQLARQGCWRQVPGAPPWWGANGLSSYSCRKRAETGGDRTMSCGGGEQDINSVSHAPGSFFQELQIPVTADQGHPPGGILTNPRCLLLHLGDPESIPE